MRRAPPPACHRHRRSPSQNVRGGKMYIQDKVEEYSDEVFDLLNNGAHIYFCGLKGMMPGGKFESGRGNLFVCFFAFYFVLFSPFTPVLLSDSFSLSHPCPPAGILEMLERVAKSKVSGMGMGAMVAPAGVSWWRSSMLCASCWDVWIFVQNGRRSPLCVIVASIGFFTSSPLPPLPRPLPPPPPRPRAWTMPSGSRPSSTRTRCTSRCTRLGVLVTAATTSGHTAARLLLPPAGATPALPHRKTELPPPAVAYPPDSALRRLSAAS